MATSDRGVLDIETVGDPWTGRLLCVGWRDETYVEPLPQPVLDELADPAIAKVTWTKYDHRFLRLRGISVAGPIHDAQVKAWLLDEAQPLDLEACAFRYLGLVMDKRIDSRGGKLVFRCDDGSVVPLGDAPMDQLTAYCRRDLAATRLLDAELDRLLTAAGRLDHWRDEQEPFTRTLAAMEARGVPVDMERSEALRVELSEEMVKLDAELHVDADLPDAFNLGSTKQLGQYLYRKSFELKSRIDIPASVRELPKAERVAAMQAKAPRRFTVDSVGRLYAQGRYLLPGLGFTIHAYTDACTEKRGPHTHSVVMGCNPSTAAPKLRTYYSGDPWIMKLLELKQRSTIVGTFLENFRERAHDGRLYGTFKQTGTDTGRLSSSEPNLQNIPARTDLGRRVRELFRPASGVFVHGDYSQLEPRLMAHWSQDPVLLDVFLTGKDLYRITAAYIFGVSYEGVSDAQRGLCKTLVLALGYGAGARKLAMILTEAGYPTDEATAARYLAELKRLYRVFFSWKEEVVRGAETVGFVQTLAGRHRRMAIMAGEDPDSWKATPTLHAANSIIQGSAADVVQRVMVRADRDFPSLGLLAQVHDELLWESAEEPSPLTLYKLRQVAERGHGFALSVPLVFVPKIVASWAEGK